MRSNDLVIQRPVTPIDLMLLLHDVASSARDLARLGAVIVCVQAPDAIGPG